MAFDISWNAFLKSVFPNMGRKLNISYEEFVKKLRENPIIAEDFVRRVLYFSLREIVQNRYDAEIEKAWEEFETFLEGRNENFLKNLEDLVLGAFEIEGKYLVYEFDEFSKDMLILGNSRKGSASVGFFGRGLKEAVSNLAVIGGAPAIKGEEGGEYRIYVERKNGIHVLEVEDRLEDGGKKYRLLIDLEGISGLTNISYEKVVEIVKDILESFREKRKAELAVRGREGIILVYSQGQDKLGMVPLTVKDPRLILSYEIHGQLLKNIEVNVARDVIENSYELPYLVISLAKDEELRKYIELIDKGEPIVKKSLDGEVYFLELSRYYYEHYAIYEFLKTVRDHSTAEALAELIKKKVGDGIALTTDARNVDRAKYYALGRPLLVITQEEIAEVLYKALISAGVDAKIAEGGAEVESEPVNLNEMDELTLRLSVYSAVLAQYGAKLEQISLSKVTFVEFPEENVYAQFNPVFKEIFIGTNTLIFDSIDFPDLFPKTKRLLRVISHEIAHIYGEDLTESHARVTERLITEASSLKNFYCIDEIELNRAYTIAILSNLPEDSKVWFEIDSGVRKLKLYGESPFKAVNLVLNSYRDLVYDIDIKEEDGEVRVNLKAKHISDFALESYKELVESGKIKSDKHYLKEIELLELASSFKNALSSYLKEANKKLKKYINLELTT